MKPYDPLCPPPSFAGLKPTRKQNRWLVELTRDPARDPVEAARRAGYKWPERASKPLTATFGDALARAAQGDGAACDLEELKIILSEVARNREHKDQVTAARTLLQLDGAFSEELAEKRTRRELEREVEDLLVQVVGRKPAPRPSRPRKQPNPGKDDDAEVTEPEEVVPE